MFNIRQKIHDADLYVRSARRGIFRIQKEQDDGSLIQLLHGYQCSRYQIAVDQLEWVEEPTRLLTIELNLASGSEGQKGTTDSNSDSSSMEISNMVPQSDEIGNFPAAFTLGGNNNYRSQKRKIAVNKE
ncbi:hypothetical protein AYI70_g4861 [Smittium culicis]|uniref:Uncharacterized protein n=1 Tax=Smittium culicis TaxID=133412 RepID=A0A1R1XX22_9FUNG|nr:hypothetical protein AYI70_g4861 [Smittium culicis]